MYVYVEMEFNLRFDAAVEEVVRFMSLKPLKQKQLEALRVFISGHDTFVALPTGYGKSIIFGVLPLLFDKLLGQCNIKK